MHFFYCFLLLFHRQPLVVKGALLGSGGSFWDLVSYQAMMGGAINSRVGVYGKTGYNPSGLKQQQMSRRFEAASLANLTTTSIRIDDVNKILYVFCSTSGKLNVVWAQRSEDFDSIKFVYKYDVIALAQANYLNAIADSAGMVTNNLLEIALNVEGLRARAEKLETDITTKWGAIPDIVLLRQA
jgi:hypothetical protein